MKKGFTLTEVLAVITLLGLLSTIAFTVVTNISSNYKQDLLEKQEQNILLAAKLWGSDHEEILPNEIDNDKMVTFEEAIANTNVDYGIIKITYGNLIKVEGMKRAINPVTKEKIKDDDYYVLIKKTSNSWSYELFKN